MGGFPGDDLVGFVDKASGVDELDGVECATTDVALVAASILRISVQLLTCAVPGIDTLTSAPQ